jgi:hypothetical protein
VTRAGEGEPIGQSLISTVTKLPELQDVTHDYAELALDALVDSGIADEIPIVKTVRAFARGVTGLHEALLMRKLAALLQGLGNFTDEEAMRFREKLRTDEQIEDFGERVIGIVDRVESATKARIIGLMLREYLSGRCDRVTFLRSIEMVDRALTEDLAFLAGQWVEGSKEPSCDRLLAVGLMTDRSERLVTESSQPPAPSAEGDLLRRSWLVSRDATHPTGN